VRHNDPRRNKNQQLILLVVTAIFVAKFHHSRRTEESVIDRDGLEMENNEK
jgi:hypothetical protein